MFLITFLSTHCSSLSGTGKVIISLRSIAEKMCGGKVSPHGIYCCNAEFSLALNHEDICNNVPHDFKIIPKQPFDDVNEELVLKNDEEEIRIHCPLYLQKLSIQIF